MGIPSPDEFKTKLTLTGAAIAYIIGASFSMGIMFAGLMGAKQDIVDDKEAAKNYTEQEVGGLRSDWERQNAILKNRDVEMMERIKELEKYHKQ